MFQRKREKPLVVVSLPHRVLSEFYEMQGLLVELGRSAAEGNEELPAVQVDRQVAIDLLALRNTAIRALSRRT